MSEFITQRELDYDNKLMIAVTFNAWQMGAGSKKSFGQYLDLMGIKYKNENNTINKEEKKQKIKNINDKIDKMMKKYKKVRKANLNGIRIV